MRIHLKTIFFAIARTFMKMALAKYTVLERMREIRDLECHRAKQSSNFNEGFCNFKNEEKSGAVRHVQRHVTVPMQLFLLCLIYLIFLLINEMVLSIYLPM